MADAQAFRDLLDILSKVDKRNFDMSTWRCHTSACAMGHAAMDERFQARGLRLTAFDERGYYDIYNSRTHNSGSEACAEIMGICIQDVLALFTGPDACRRTLEEEIIRLKYYCHINNISL